MNKRSEYDQINDLFGLVYQQNFINEEIGDVLKDAFENGRDPRIVKTLKDFMTHNDYLEMKNQM